MNIWTIYENPTDYPGKFVARLWEGEVATHEVMVADWLEVLQVRLRRRGLVKLMRQPEDDPVIVETWL